MTIVVYPTLHLSANGSTALLDNPGVAYQILSVPALQSRFGTVACDNVATVVMSSSGTAVGVQMTANQFMLLSTDQRPTFTLPREQSAIRGIALSDKGDQVAILAVEQSQTSNAQADNGILEIWSLPLDGSHGPLASVRLPLYDSGVVTANGTFSTFVVRSTNAPGNQQFLGVYRYDSDKGKLLSLWQEQGASLSRTHVVLYGEWIWAVQAQAIVGWYAHNDPVELPATLREHLIYSQTGSHLLVYRGEETINVTSQKMLFRLFDLASLQEVKRATHVIQNYNTATFVVTQDLSLLELRATREGGVALKELPWSTP